MTGIRITKNQLLNLAIQSVREKNDLSMFWEYVKQARQFGLLDKSDEMIKLMLSPYENLIYGKGAHLHEQDTAQTTHRQP